MGNEEQSEDPEIEEAEIEALLDQMGEEGNIEEDDFSISEDSLGPISGVLGGDDVDLDDLPDGIKRLFRIKVPIIAVLARKQMNLEEVLSLHPGMVLELGKPLHSPLDICIGGERIASGETVKVGEHFGIQIKDIQSAEETLKAMESLQS